MGRKKWCSASRMLSMLLVLVVMAMLTVSSHIPVTATSLVQASGIPLQQEYTVAAVTTLPEKKFPDVPENAWYASDLRFITSDARKILEGSSDGRFYPELDLTVEQFIKCVIVAAGFRPTSSGGHWAQPFIDKALSMEIIRQGQFSSFSKGMTRGEMAVVIMDALTSMTGERVPEYNLADISARMGDYASIPASQRNAICSAYHLGILTGTPDGKFHPEWILTRSQAVAVIRRVIDASARIELLPLGATEGADIWTDAEFQAFMSTDEWKRYLNPNTIAGMKDGVLLFQETIIPDNFDETEDFTSIHQVPVVLPEPEYSLYYNLAKTLGYYAKKYEATATVGFMTEVGGLLEFDFSPNGGWHGLTPDLCFRVHIGNIRNRAPDIYAQFPSANDVDLQYMWEIGEFYKYEEYEQYSMINEGQYYDISQEKYVQILFKTMELLYSGDSAAYELSKFIINVYDEIRSENVNALIIDSMQIAPEVCIFSYYPSIRRNLTFFSNGVQKR